MSASKLNVPDRSRSVGATEEEILLERLIRMERRCARERAAREEAERLLEAKSLELFEINQNLVRLNDELEARVSSRTAALSRAKKAALDLVDTDQLTRLSSRYRFHQQLRRKFEHAATTDGRLALLLIDIDHFKAVNDTYGHGHGDELLVQVAARLAVAARRRDYVSRLGGDELAILLEDTGQDGAEAVVERVLECFQASFHILGITISCTASIGIATYPEHAFSPEELQRAADLALYRAKADGRNRSAVFKDHLLEDHQLRHRHEAELKHSITSSEIEVWYQPIVDLRTGRNRAIEALARIKGQDGKYLPPNVFIPLAEEIGLIRDLGRQVLRKSVSQAQHWISDGLVDLVTVNVSAEEFLAHGFADDVLEALASANMPGDRLVMEITESVMMIRLDAVQEIMHGLSTKGVSFALDDFGCGYTNLAYLRQLPIRKVKLDISLLADVADDVRAQAIVRHVVSLCKELESVTVCEGVETWDQLQFIRSIGCDLGQGYLLGRPMPAEIAAKVLLEGRNDVIAGLGNPPGKVGPTGT